MWVGDLQRPGQSRDRTHPVDAHQSLDALLQTGSQSSLLINCFCVDSNISIEPRLMRSRSFTDSGTSSQALHQIGEVFLPMQPRLSNGAPLSISRPAILFCIRTDCCTTMLR